MKSNILVAVEDLMLGKEIKTMLGQSNMPYADLTPEIDAEIAWDSFKQHLRANETNEVILYLRPPKLKLGSNFDLLAEDNLNVVLRFIQKFNGIHENLLRLNGDKRMKILLIANRAETEDPVSVILNNYMWKYYEGLLIETKRYGVELGFMFKTPRQSFWNHGEKLVEFLSGTHELLFTNVPKKEVAAELTFKSRPKINQVLNWPNDKKRVAIVTGASGGIGLEIGKYLIERDWRVYSLSRKSGIDHGIIYVACDLKDPNSIQKATGEILSKEKKIHLLVNNSGFGIGSSLENLDAAAFEEMYRVNVIGALGLTRTLSDVLSASGGTVVNVGSMAGIFTIPFQAAYSLTKAVIDVYSDLVMADLNYRNVRIATLMPGDTKSNFHENRKMSQRDGQSRYRARLERSIGKMAKEEAKGHDPRKVAKTLYKAVSRPKLPIRFAVGKYRLFFYASRRICYVNTHRIIDVLYGENK